MMQNRQKASLVRREKKSSIHWEDFSQPFSIVLTLAGAVLLWECIVILFSIPQYIVPSPWQIAIRFANEWQVLLQHGWHTFYEVLLGFSVSVIIGIPLAIMIIYSKYLANTIYPILVGVHCIPMVSLAPLLVIWFGFGLVTKVLIAFMISFFPIVINSVVGMQSTDKEMINLARSMKATPVQLFVYFRLPKALPSIFGGCKVGITLAVVGAVVAEFVSSTKGLGYLQLVANSQLDTALEFCALIMLALMGIGLFYIMHFFERLAMPWHHGTREGNTGVWKRS